MNNSILIKNWDELSKFKESDKYFLKVNLEMCNAWLIPKNEKDKRYYLSTHTFYGNCYKYSSNLLKECGFNLILDNWDSLKNRFEELEPGTKILATIENTSTAIIYKEKMIYEGKIIHDGFLTECGAWSLYEIPGVISECYKVLLKKCGKNFYVALDFELKDFKILKNKDFG